MGVFVLNDFNIVLSFEATYELFISLLTELWILKTLGFAILVGSVMALVEKSGGIDGFVKFMVDKKSFIASERSSLMLSYAIGVFILIESSITA